MQRVAQVHMDALWWHNQFVEVLWVTWLSSSNQVAMTLGIWAAQAKVYETGPAPECNG